MVWSLCPTPPKTRSPGISRGNRHWAGLTPAERRSYEASLKAYRDRLAIKAQEKIERERREERLRAIREEAWAAGIAEGIAEGRAEAAMQIVTKEVALRMVALKIPTKEVTEILEVTEEQIAAWLAEQKGEA